MHIETIGPNRSGSFKREMRGIHMHIETIGPNRSGRVKREIRWMQMHIETIGPNLLSLPFTFKAQNASYECR